jgi:hypothetical protein
MLLPRSPFTKPWLLLGFLAFAAACADPGTTAPDVDPSFNTVPAAGTVTVCKDASAPAGMYDFEVSQEGGRGGTLPAGSSFSLAAGDCVVAWEALPDPPEPDNPPVAVTVTEVVVPGGAVFDSVTVDSDAEGFSSSTDPSATVLVNYYHNAVYTYYNSENPMAPGRMTGGGGQIRVDGVRITRGLTIHCDITLSNNIEINWSGGNKWHIDKPLDSALCIDDPNIDPTPPDAPFDTFIGEADGELNGMPGSILRFTFIDAGEPGIMDQAYLMIWAPGDDPDTDDPILEAGGYLDNGNLQAHFDQPHKN